MENSKSKTYTFNADNADSFIRKVDSSGMDFSVIGRSKKPCGLSRQELDYLVSSHPYFYNLVYKPAQSATAELPQLGTDSDAIWNTINKVKILNENLGNLDFIGLIRQALVFSRLYGDSFIILGVDDGKPLSTPLGEVKRLVFMKLLPPESVALDNKEQILITSNEKVHYSKVLRFKGIEYHHYNSNFNLSYIEHTYSAYNYYLTALDAVKGMLDTHSVFKYGIKGFTQYLLNDKDNRNQQGLAARFKCVLDGIQNFNALLYDTNNESAEFVNRSYSGIDTILEHLLNWLVSSSGMPRFQILNYSGANSLSEASEGERLQWSEYVKNYQQSHCTPVYVKVANLLGFELTAQDITYTSQYPLTQKEQLMAASQKVDDIIKLTSAGIITVDEAKNLLKSVI